MINTQYKDEKNGIKILYEFIKNFYNTRPSFNVNKEFVNTCINIIYICLNLTISDYSISSALIEYNNLKYTSEIEVMNKRINEYEKINGPIEYNINQEDIDNILNMTGCNYELTKKSKDIIIKFKLKTQIGKFLTFIIDIDRLIRGTTNNPNSSRSHVLLFMQLELKKSKETIKPYLILGDFAGVENKFNCTDPNVINKFSNISRFNNDEVFYNETIFDKDRNLKYKNIVSKEKIVDNPDYDTKYLEKLRTGGAPDSLSSALPYDLNGISLPPEMFNDSNRTLIINDATIFKDTDTTTVMHEKCYKKYFTNLVKNNNDFKYNDCIRRKYLAIINKIFDDKNSGKIQSLINVRDDINNKINDAYSETRTDENKNILLRIIKINNTLFDYQSNETASSSKFLEDIIEFTKNPMVGSPRHVFFNFQKHNIAPLLYTTDYNAIVKLADKFINADEGNMCLTEAEKKQEAFISSVQDATIDLTDEHFIYNIFDEISKKPKISDSKMLDYKFSSDFNYSKQFNKLNDAEIIYLDDMLKFDKIKGKFKDDSFIDNLFKTNKQTITIPQ